MNSHQLYTETLIKLSEILQVPPPSVMMQWIPIGSGELKVSYTIARLTTWIDDINEYADNNQDNQDCLKEIIYECLHKLLGSDGTHRQIAENY